MRAAIRKIKVAATLLLLPPLAACIAAQQAEAVLAAGAYDGSQMELAAGLELGIDGRYRYGLSYGAVDEFSQGRWTSAKGGIVLSSDPSTLPQFELLNIEEHSGSEDMLTLSLHAPALPLPLFSAIVEYGDGTTAAFDFSEQDLEIPVLSDQGAVSISLLLPIYDVRGEPIPLSSPAGTVLRLAFVPNDLGFKAFDNHFLPKKDEALLLERYGRTISFHKIAN